MDIFPLASNHKKAISKMGILNTDQNYNLLL